MSKNSAFYYTRVRLNTENTRENICRKLFELIPYKKNKFLGVATEEFIEKYGIDPDKISKKELEAFLDSYDLIKASRKAEPIPAYAMRSVIAPIPQTPISAAQQPSPAVSSGVQNESSESTSETEFDNELSKNVLGPFGIQ